jgi:hypothetical protein
MNKELVPLKAHNLGNLSSFDINLNISEEKRITAWEVYKTLFPNKREFKKWTEDNILNRENFENGKQYFLKKEYVLIVDSGLQSKDIVRSSSQSKDIVKLSNLIELEVPEEQREVLLLNYAEKMKTKQLKSA